MKTIAAFALSLAATLTVPGLHAQEAAPAAARPASQPASQSAAQPASQPASQSASQSAPQIAPATEAATRWLAVMDAGKAAEAWDAGAPVMQSAITRDMWNKVGTDARAPLGAVKSRKQTSANFTRTLPGVPEGEYVVIQYATDFANRAGVTETVVPMRLPDGSWKVTTYLIR